MTSATVQYEVNLEEEICCEICMEVVHFHIEECPVCGATSAETNFFGSVSECIDEDEGKFTCGECDSEFQIIERIERYHDGEVGDTLVCLVSTGNDGESKRTSRRSEQSLSSSGIIGLDELFGSKIPKGFRTQ